VRRLIAIAILFLSPTLAYQTETLLDNLDTIWEISFAPDGRMFITERSGILSVYQDGELKTLAKLEVVGDEQGEPGLMGFALDPEFPTEPYLYLCYTYDDNDTLDDGAWNRLQRFRLEGEQAVPDKILVDGMRGGWSHNGCRVKFAPDGTLFFTMGDGGQMELAQDLKSLNGKVMRINKDGSIPSDNPFPGSPIYTYGHRNPQGLDFHPVTGIPYETEHGPSENDEVNRLLPGRNYGWPEVGGTRKVGDYEPALWAWSPTVAPAGIAFDGPDTLYLGTLRNRRLYRLEVSPEGTVNRPRQVVPELGRVRVRAVTKGPDGCLYVSTSTQNGHGRPDGQGNLVSNKVVKICDLTGGSR
jgi:glucose/arabinose dehydrogenase